MTVTRKSLTARELIAALEKIEPETVVTWSEWDSERDFTYIWGIAGISPGGSLFSSEILHCYDGLGEIE